MKVISIKSQNIKLESTLLLPDGTELIALLVNGSGKIDRDGNMGKLKLNTSKEIAAYLFQQGIASIRCDKRGVGESQGDFLETTFEDNLSDVNAWIDYIKSAFPEKKCIIIGHSEGALIATRIAAQRKDLDGIVLLAGFASNGRDVLCWQMKEVIASLQGFHKWLLKIVPINPEKKQAKFLDRVEQSQDNVIRIMKIKKFNAGWLRQMLRYNPADDFPHVHCPILAITGKKDLQVPVSDLTKMQQKAQVPIECHAIADLTHLLRKDKKPASISRYKALIKEPIDNSVLSIIHQWIVQRINTVTSSG